MKRSNIGVGLHHLATGLALLAFVGLGVSSAGGAVVINEFMAINDTTTHSELGRYSDWIELYNPSAGPADLGGFYLTDSTSAPTKFRIPDGTWLQGNGRLLIWADGTTQPGVAPPFHAPFRLDGSDGEAIILYDRDGATTVDAIRFGQQAPDISYGRITDGHWMWGPFFQPTPGAANLGYAPPPSRLAGVVFINEWMARNKDTIRDRTGESADWIELYNASDIPIDLGGYYLTDDHLTPFKWCIPQASVIAPHGFAFFWADDDEFEGPTHAGFNLNGDMGEEIGLYEKDGVTQIDLVTFGPQWQDISEGRWPDGASEMSFFSHPTPGASNVTSSTLVRSWEYYR